ncbi:polysaccharide biosynthesis/export family protein, partial [Bacteroides nordii]|uniref:polysaccharide biosynthesis/export family protein n=1 Tax=Bacteroides nordii TaxID=291645 RepID=UPI00241F3E6D
MNRAVQATMVVALCLVVMSCASSRRVVYLQEKSVEIPESSVAFDARIMPKDLITISVSTPEPEAALPFNLIVPSAQSGNSLSSLVSQPTLQNYLVNNEGEISFPVLGQLKVGGLTTQQTSEMIISQLHKYLKEPPIVTVRLINYKVSVIGEVNRPNMYTVINEKINVFEALAMAGDLTIYGRRDRIRIMREDINSPSRYFSDTTFLNSN